jgi:hypothetical protein
MKAIFYVLLLAAVGVGVYRFRDQIQGFIEGKAKADLASEEAPEGTIRVLPDPADDGKAGETGEPGEADPTTPAPGSTADEGAETTAGTSPDPAEAGAAAAAAASDPRIAEVIARHPLPQIAPLEEFVDGWRAIPTTAFPREVTLRSDVKMTLAGGRGESTVPAGTKVFAMSIDEHGVVTVRPSRQSEASGEVPLEGTDLKEVLTAVYNNYLKRTTRVVLAQRAREIRELRQSEMAAKAAEAAAAALVGPQPAVLANGQVPVAVASIRAKEVTDFDLGVIDAWGPVLYDEIDGEPYWTVSVNYEAETIFGKFPAEAVALIRQGKVEKWVFAGSGEPVP